MIEITNGTIEISKAEYKRYIQMEERVKIANKMIDDCDDIHTVIYDVIGIIGIYGKEKDDE